MAHAATTNPNVDMTGIYVPQNDGVMEIDVMAPVLIKQQF